MKICPVCKAAVNDDAEYCDNCGNDEFYDQPQQFGQYEQPYQNDYNEYQQPQYQNDYNNYQQPQYQNDYNNYQQPAQPQYQNGYNNYQQPAQPQYQNGYNNYQQPVPPQYQNDYNNYQQPAQPQYQNGYNNYQQPAQPQYQNGYNDYQQPAQPQYQNDYNNYQQPAQPQYQENYEQAPYQQPASIQKQPVYEEEQQPVYEEEQPQPAEEEQQTVEESVPVEEQPAEISEQPEEQAETEEAPAEPEEPEEPEGPKENPYEVSKNFVFEKTVKQQPQEEQPAEKPKNVKGFIQMIMNTKEHTIEFDKEDISKNQKNALIACFGVTFWLPFISKDYSRYARFYGNQGLLTLITMVPSIIFYSLIMGVVICNACTASVYSNGAEVFKYLTFGGWIAAIIFFAICFAIPIFIIYCSVTNIKQGKAKDIPFIGRLRLIS